MRSLNGKAVLVTRPRHQAGPLAEALENLGATVHLMPAIEIAGLENTNSLDDALKSLDGFDWVVLTSVNGVDAVKTRMAALGIPTAKLAERKIAAIGPATAKAIEQSFRTPDLVPEEYISEAIATAFDTLGAERRTPTAEPRAQSPERGTRKLSFLLLRADLARPDLANRLRDMGHEVTEIAVYRIVRAKPSDLPEHAPDAITLTSAEAARATNEILTTAGRGDWMQESALVCIGPITAEAVSALGYEPAATADEYTAEGLLNAIVQTIGMEAAHA